MQNDKQNLIDAVEELLEMMEEKDICDENELIWVTSEDCIIESSRSPEFIDLFE